MAILWVCQYDITNPELFAKYNPGSLESIMKVVDEVGGVVVAAGEPTQIAGEARHAGVAIQFPNAAALDTWLNHPDYAEAKAIREAATTNYAMFMLDAMG